MSKPVLTEEEKSKLEQAIDTLNSSILWHAENSNDSIRSLRNTIILFTVLSVISLIVFISSTIMFGLGTEVQKISLCVFILFLVADIVFVCSALYSTKISYDDIMLLYNNDNLWLIAPSEDTDKNQNNTETNFMAQRKLFWTSKTLDRYEMLNVREYIHGRSLEKPIEYDDALLKASRIVKLNSKDHIIDGWTVEKIEDIDNITTDEENNETRFSYVDGLTKTKKNLIIDNDQWCEFVSWLNEQQNENTNIL